jgi:hypothetical protein
MGNFASCYAFPSLETHRDFHVLKVSPLKMARKALASGYNQTGSGIAPTSWRLPGRDNVS